MSFSVYPSSEIITPFAYNCCLNGIYSRPFLYASEANVSPISNPAIPSYLSSVPSNSLNQEIPNIITEAHKDPGTYPMHGFFNVHNIQNMHQELWPNQNSRLIGGHQSGSKKPEIWRPFSPSPTKEHPEDIIKRVNQNHPLIIPSRVKIEHSKTSLFKPVKKKGFRCSHCSSSFISSAQLISHLRVHTGKTKV